MLVTHRYNNMDKNISTDQIKVILNNAPANVDKTALLKKFADSGYIIEGYNSPPPTLADDNDTAIAQEGAKIKSDFNRTSPETKDLGRIPAATTVVKDALVDLPMTLIGNLAKHTAGGGDTPSFSDAGKDPNAPDFKPSGTDASIVIDKVKDAIGFKPQPTQEFIDAVNSFTDKHPEAAKFLNDTLATIKPVGEIAGTIAGADAAVGGVKDLAVQTVKDGVDAAAAAPATPTPEVTAAATAKNTQTAIDAVNPDLTGKKLAGSYADIVKNGRTVTPSGLFTEQSLAPSERAVATGTRLSTELPLSTTLADGTADTLPAVQFTGTPVKDLQALGDNLNQTEEKLTTALKGDPEINMNADKPTLQKNLADLKTNAPREFNSNIKDNTNQYDNVINFAQELIDASDDSIMGLRDARTAFDAQAKREFPSAFKDGFIDTKTPQGAAIKSARDVINEHLYNTAPNGSDIKALVGREADIFNATDAIAPKAAALDGQNWFQQFTTKYPKLTKRLGIGLAGVGGVDVLRKVL